MDMENNNENYSAFCLSLNEKELKALSEDLDTDYNIQCHPEILADISDDLEKIRADYSGIIGNPFNFLKIIEGIIEAHYFWN